MARHLLSSAASAVTGELARELFSGLRGKLDRKAAAATVDKKLRRLDMLLTKINSAVEASEKHAIGNNASLVKWRDNLKEAAAEGGEVLVSFRQQEVDAAAQAQATGDGDAAQQHQQEDPSSSSSTALAMATAAITGNSNTAPASIAQGIFSATKTLLFSSEEDMERLNNAVERLEDLSGEISIFIKLLKLEILALAPAPAPASAPAPTLIWAENGGNLKRERPAYSINGDDSPSFKTFGFQIGAVAEPAGQIQMDQTVAAQGVRTSERSEGFGIGSSRRNEDDILTESDIEAMLELIFNPDLQVDLPYPMYKWT